VGYFYSLAIVNNAAVNMDVQCLYYILTYIPSDISPGAVLLDRTVVLFLVFGGASILPSIVVVLIYIPTKKLHLHPHLLCS
jgi:hypothetical protein